MRSVEENIEALSRAMLGDAKTEAEKILAEAKEKAEQINRQAEEEANKERSQILDKARQEADRLRSQVIATTQMKTRTNELEHREKLLDNVFTLAKNQMADVSKRSDYESIAKKLVREGLLQLKGSNIVIHAAPKTQSCLSKATLDELGKEFNIKIDLGDKLEQGTGVILETEDKHLVYDNTLETRLSRLQNTLRPPVYRILIGETL